MSHFLNLLGLASIAMVAVYATPLPDGSVSNAQVEQPYLLRVNAPNKPWHGRWLVAMPEDNFIGLDNFTVNPPTPPVKLLPTRLESGLFVLRGEAVSNSDSEPPTLTAIEPKDGTNTVSIKVISADDQDTCSDDFDCTTDQWDLEDADQNGVYANLQFTGFQGTWEPIKDASPHGWHVYWNGNATVYSPVQIDLVPYTETN